MIKYINIYNNEIEEGEIWLGLSTIDDREDASFLSGSNQSTYHTFEHTRRKQEFLESRAILKDMAEKAGFDVATLEFKKTSRGRPFGQTASEGFYVSIAHTDHYVFCGLSRNRSIGVDLEPTKRKVKHKIRERILTDEELKNPTLQEVSTLRLWTIKEAIVKLTGGGLGRHLAVSHITQTDTYVFKATVKDYKDIRIYSRKYLDHWIAVALTVS